MRNRLTFVAMLFVATVIGATESPGAVSQSSTPIGLGNTAGCSIVGARVEALERTSRPRWDASHSTRVTVATVASSGSRQTGRSASATQARADTNSCPVSDQRPCVVQLRGGKTPSVSANCTEEPWSRFLTFTLPDRVSDSNHDGWWETVMKIALDASKGCSCAIFRVFYDEPQKLISVDIGDSPTNNGMGGDEGTTFREAEMQIHNTSLYVYTASRDGVLQHVEMIYETVLPPLAGRSMDLTVCDESLAFSMPAGPRGAPPLSWKLRTPVSGLLYDLTPSASYEGGIIAKKKKDDGIYAAFNRVIHEKGGLPSPRSRTGTGVRRVEVRLVQ